MKVIDLYIKIANDELKDETKFKYDGDYFKYCKDIKQFNRYTDNTYSKIEYYNDMLFDISNLNDEVEIIEDISNLKWGEYVIKVDVKKCSEKDLRTYISLLMETQNKIIDKVKGDK